VVNLDGFWQAIESLPSRAAVEAEWQALVGDAYDWIKPFLKLRRERASSFPRPDGGLPYEVVEHAADDFVGVCPETGETITLNKTQLAVYQLDEQQLADHVAKALGFGAANIVGSIGRLFSLGILRPKGNSLGVFLMFPRDPAEVESSAAWLISLGHSPFLLITPTRQFLTGDLELRLRSLGSAHLALVEALVSDRGQWRIAAGAIQAALPDRPATLLERPLSGRAKEVLVGMLELEAFDSDSCQPTSEIAQKSLGLGADASSLKSVMSDLARRKLIETREGRSGGCWLTEAGRKRAEKLQTNF
jgi:hypothetical protein